MNKQTINFKRSKAALNFGLPTNKLALNNINHIYAACRMADGPLPPMNMYIKNGSIYYIDGKCPLSVQDYINLFSSKSTIGQIKSIIKKLSISYDQTNQPTKKYLVTVIKTYLKQSGVNEPLHIPVPGSTSNNRNRSPNSVNQNSVNQNLNQNSMNQNSVNQNSGTNQNLNQNSGTNQNRNIKIQNIKNRIMNMKSNTRNVNIPVAGSVIKAGKMFGNSMKSAINSGKRATISTTREAGTAVRQASITGGKLGQRYRGRGEPIRSRNVYRNSTNNNNNNLNNQIRNISSSPNRNDDSNNISNDLKNIRNSI
jgi:hypothetical protein